MTVDMELFSHYWQLVEAHGWLIYDHLPAPAEEDSIDYPFVVIGEIDNTSGGDKSALGGTVNLVIDVWGKREDRPAVSMIANGILMASIGTWCTKNYQFTGYKNAQQVQVSNDTSVANTVYTRGMVSLQLEID